METIPWGSFIWCSRLAAALREDRSRDGRQPVYHVWPAARRLDRQARQIVFDQPIKRVSPASRFWTSWPRSSSLRRLSARGGFDTLSGDSSRVVAAKVASRPVFERRQPMQRRLPASHVKARRATPLATRPSGSSATGRRRASSSRSVHQCSVPSSFSASKSRRPSRASPRYGPGRWSSSRPESPAKRLFAAAAGQPAELWPNDMRNKPGRQPWETAVDRAASSHFNS